MPRTLVVPPVRLPVVLHQSARSFRFTRTAGWVLAIWVAASASALNAQVTGRAEPRAAAEPPIYTAPHVDPRDEPGLPPRGAAASRVIPGTGASDTRGPAALPPPRASAALIEMPAAGYRLGGGSSRPHHAIGFRSTAAESWLREQGIDARHCYLPMLRARARVTPSGEANAAFWVYARCSLR